MMIWRKRGVSTERVDDAGDGERRKYFTRVFAGEGRESWWRRWRGLYQRKLDGGAQEAKPGKLLMSRFRRVAAPSTSLLVHQELEKLFKLG
jgi:hypothetical protein